MKRLFILAFFILAKPVAIQAFQAQSAQSQKAAAKKPEATNPAEKNSAQKKPVEKSARELAFQRIDTSRDAKIDVEEFVGGSVGKAADNKRQEFAEFDLNKDGGVDFEEFKKRGNKPPDRSKMSEDFKNRDKDSSGSLTLTEFLGKRTGEQRTQARTTFFRFDSDGNDQLTLEEYLVRDSKGKLSVHSHFRQLDLNDDNQLTEQEFMRTRIGKKGEKSGRDNFREFDTNHDLRLSEPEFAMLPTNHPDAATVFQAHDGNRDGQLTLQEHLAGKQEGKSQLAARDAFYRMDANGDGRLSGDEFVQIVPKAKDDSKNKGKAKTPINVTSHFRQLDLDNNGKVTEQEFLRLKAGKKGEQSGRDSFRKFDLDGNGQLTESELAILPVHKPDAVSMFGALDLNHNGSLSPAELTRLMGPDQSGRAEGTFASYDKDANGELSFDEYLSRKSSLEQQKSRRAWMRLLETWGIRLLIGLDGVIMLLGARWAYRQFGRSPAPAGKRARMSSSV